MIDLKDILLLLDSITFEKESKPAVPKENKPADASASPASVAAKAAIAVTPFDSKAALEALETSNGRFPPYQIDKLGQVPLQGLDVQRAHAFKHILTPKELATFESRNIKALRQLLIDKGFRPEASATFFTSNLDAATVIATILDPKTGVPAEQLAMNDHNGIVRTSLHYKVPANPPASLRNIHYAVVTLGKDHEILKVETKPLVEGEMITLIIDKNHPAAKAKVPLHPMDRFIQTCFPRVTSDAVEIIDKQIMHCRNVQLSRTARREVREIEGLGPAAKPQMVVTKTILPRNRDLILNTIKPANFCYQLERIRACGTISVHNYFNGVAKPVSYFATSGLKFSEFLSVGTPSAILLKSGQLSVNDNTEVGPSRLADAQTKSDKKLALDQAPVERSAAAAAAKSPAPAPKREKSGKKDKKAPVPGPTLEQQTKGDKKLSLEEAAVVRSPAEGVLFHYTQLASVLVQDKGADKKENREGLKARIAAICNEINTNPNPLFAQFRNSLLHKLLSDDKSEKSKFDPDGQDVKTLEEYKRILSVLKASIEKHVDTSLSREVLMKLDDAKRAEFLAKVPAEILAQVTAAVSKIVISSDGNTMDYSGCDEEVRDTLKKSREKGFLKGKTLEPDLLRNTLIHDWVNKQVREHNKQYVAGFNPLKDLVKAQISPAIESLTSIIDLKSKRQKVDEGKKKLEDEIELLGKLLKDLHTLNENKIFAEDLSLANLLKVRTTISAIAGTFRDQFHRWASQKSETPSLSFLLDQKGGLNSERNSAMAENLIVEMNTALKAILGIRSSLSHPKLEHCKRYCSVLNAALLELQKYNALKDASRPTEEILRAVMKLSEHFFQNPLIVGLYNGIDIKEDDEGKAIKEAMKNAMGNIQQAYLRYEGIRNARLQMTFCHSMQLQRVRTAAAAAAPCAGLKDVPTKPSGIIQNSTCHDTFMGLFVQFSQLNAEIAELEKRIHAGTETLESATCRRELAELMQQSKTMIVLFQDQIGEFRHKREIDYQGLQKVASNGAGSGKILGLEDIAGFLVPCRA